jgi:hypothetical protein
MAQSGPRAGSMVGINGMMVAQTGPTQSHKTGVAGNQVDVNRNEPSPSHRLLGNMIMPSTSGSLTSLGDPHINEAQGSARGRGKHIEGSAPFGAVNPEEDEHKAPQADQETFRARGKQATESLAIVARCNQRLYSTRIRAEREPAGTLAPGAPRLDYHSRLLITIAQ